MKSYTYFVGIDVSKNKLDCAVLNGKTYVSHQVIKNEEDDIASYISALKALPKFTISKSVFCMENTGLYNNPLLKHLKKVKANIVMQDAVHIRRSLGTLRGKYDKIDSIRIANYAYKSRDELKLWTPRRLVIQQLAHLSSLRKRLITVKISLKMPLKEQKEFLDRATSKLNIRLSNDSVLALEADIVKVETHIKLLVKDDPEISRLMKLVTSVKSIGPETALQIIISTNEFKDITNPKKFACYAGVAPFRSESGSSVNRARVSTIANKKLKSLLHICAINAVRRNKELKTYYDRKTQGEGKPKMAVLNAVRYKLILRVFACVNQNRYYNDELVTSS